MIYEEEGVEIIFENPSKLELEIIFPDKDYKKPNRKRCDILCITSNKRQYYVELKTTYRSEAIRQLMDTIEDFLKEFPAGSKAKEAYVVCRNEQKQPRARTKTQRAKDEFAEKLKIVLRIVYSPFYLSVE